MNTDTLLQSEGASSKTLHKLIATEVKKIANGTTESILDLGCGQGEFLKLLRSNSFTNLHGTDGYHYTGLDATLFQFSQADLNQILPFPDSSFSIVTAIEVIEHLENPRHFLREVSRILKPGGWALVSTPNNECLTSMLSLLMRGYFSSFSDRCYPAHITPVLKVDMNRMMNEAKLTEQKISFTNRGRIPKTAINWQSIFPFLRGRLFSDNFVMIGRKPDGSK